MGLPLQPDLVPWTPGQRRWLLIAVVLGATLLLGMVAGSRSQPPRLLGSHGHPGVDDYHTTALRLIAGARRRVTAVVYVMRLDDDGPVEHLVQALGAAVRRGVAVQVVLDRGRDWKTGGPDTKHLDPAARLAGCGVRVILDEEERTTHAKVMVVDDRLVLVGSHNWTRSALLANREWSLLVDDPLIAAQIQAEVAAIPKE